MHKLDYLAKTQGVGGDPHPLQRTVEDLVDTVLTEKERAVFYMRFGERLPHRTIAERLGYKSHMVIQVIEERIIEKIGAALRDQDSEDTH